MPSLDLLTFDVTPPGAHQPSDHVVLTPRINGESLVEIVGRYEARRGYEPAGGYTGLTEHYYVVDGREHPVVSAWTWVLGCGDCGEPSCWPLRALIDVTVGEVIWSGFAQPFRPDWSYQEIGPYVFDRLDRCDILLDAAHPKWGTRAAGRSY